MDPILRSTVWLQRAAVRSMGFFGAALMAAYLVWWASGTPPQWLTWTMSALFLLFLWRGLKGLSTEVEPEARAFRNLGIFSALIVGAYALILRAPGGMTGPYYPFVFIVLMVAAAYGRPAVGFGVALFAAFLELAIRIVAWEENDIFALGARLSFLLAFAGLNFLLFRAEIARVRRISQKKITGELERIEDAARAFRLSGGTEGSEEQATSSAVGEVQRGAQFALRMLANSLDLRTAAILAFDGKNSLKVFDAISSCSLKSARISAQNGVIAIALDRREPLCVYGQRAATHLPLYQDAQVVGSLCVVPVYEEDAPRAVLVVDREEEVAFDEKTIESLKSAAQFLVQGIQNERVFTALERASREQGKLYRAASALGAASTEADVIEIGVESAREVAAFDFAAVTLFQRKGGLHEICAVSGVGADALIGKSFRQNAGLVSMAVANRQALPWRGDYEPAKQLVFARGYEPPAMPSLLVLPLIAQERVLGTLVLGSQQRRAFRESVRPALEILASHMAISLSNARMLKTLEEQATTDGMTGLLNKRTLIEDAQRRIKSAERFKKPLSLLVTDIDHFKRVNDTYGHDIGDIVIKGLGDVLRRVKRDTDVVGRFGGEEFVIVCEQTDEDGARQLAERIRRELETTSFQTPLGPLSVTGSVGVATFPAAGRDYETLFKACDEALYVSKRSGRNQVNVWTPRLKQQSSTQASA
ncbi:MAG: sensor domain-containing diguanylate cyclase [Polyangiaceae bacterium]|nr:sensor domain-containing diguanylate cyclase [Polyangiaceae bacterium]